MRLVWLCMLAGCGRFGFDAHPDGGAVDSGGLPDAPDMVGAFTTVKLPPGGHARSLALYNTFANYYVGYAGGRVFHVVDGVWSECASLGGDIRKLALAKDGTLYGGRRDDQVQFSTDNCASWSAALPTPTGLYAIAAGDSNAYVGGYDGVWQFTRSTSMFTRMVSPFDGEVVRDIVVGSGGRIGVTGDTRIGV